MRCQSFQSGIEHDIEAQSSDRHHGATQSRMDRDRQNGAAPYLNVGARAEKIGTDLGGAATGVTYQDGVVWDGSALGHSNFLRLNNVGSSNGLVNISARCFFDYIQRIRMYPSGLYVHWTLHSSTLENFYVVGDQIFMLIFLLASEGV